MLQIGLALDRVGLIEIEIEISNALVGEYFGTRSLPGRHFYCPSNNLKLLRVCCKIIVLRGGSLSLSLSLSGWLATIIKQTCRERERASFTI